MRKKNNKPETNGLSQPGWVEPTQSGVSLLGAGAGAVVGTAMAGPAGAIAGAVVGQGVVETFRLWTANTLGRRDERFLTLLYNDLQELKARIQGFDPSRLGTNEAWVSSFLQARDAALRTHIREKLDALRA